jgi:SAM-dependent methyltransferase
LTAFDAYSRYYDLLYADKDYDAEAKYILRLLSDHAPGARSLLDLGCGTGRHAALFAHNGLRVHGVELSQEMHRRAQVLRDSLPEDVRRRFTLQCADALTIRINETFDAVTALFHVLSYQTRTADVARFFAIASEHLNVGGIFVFDCWYGPAVLALRPESRLKAMSDEVTEVLRFATPRMRPNENLTEVHYRILVRNRSLLTCEEIRECHEMRHFFVPELRMFLDAAGFALEKSAEFMSGRDLGLDTWGACFVARKM